MDHWAIIIGIDAYEQRPLQGAVRDALSIKNFLETATHPVQVELLTAKMAHASPKVLVDEGSQLPTYENMNASMERVTNLAKDGDYVYIHFSGHGTILPVDPSKPDGKREVALVLLDDGRGTRYLPGQRLAQLLQVMVGKGLLVTVVLDCCFSGGVRRKGGFNSEGLRTIPYNPSVDVTYPVNDDEVPTVPPTFRDTRMLPNWIVNPAGYTIFAACGPSEEARELVFQRERHGALSLFLLETLLALRKSAVEVTVQSIYHLICCKFHANKPTQNPMLYGNRKLTFFGGLWPGSDLQLFSVFKTQEYPLLLSAGQAHGVRRDDEFDLFSLHDSGRPLSTEQEHIRVRAKTVWGLKSELVHLEAADSVQQVRTGWKAKPVANMRLPNYLVHIMVETADFDEWLAASKGKQFAPVAALDYHAQKDSVSFSVLVNEQRKYEISNESLQSLQSVPQVSIDEKNAISQVINALNHLVIFKYFEGIENRFPSAEFSRTFSIELRDSFQNIVSGILEISEGRKMSLILKNVGLRPVYVNILYLGPLWQIKNLLSAGGGNDYEVLDPKINNGEKVIDFSSEIPGYLKSRGQKTCDDILKVFVTSSPTNFATMEMEELQTCTQRSNNVVSRRHRRFLKATTKAFTAFRGGSSPAETEKWATQNFIIRSTLNEEELT